jgi:hypothetical protein
MRRTTVLLAVALAVLATVAALGRDAALAAFDGDGFADLAIGAPGENAAAGAVNVLDGSPDGLAGLNQTLTQAASEAGDGFGTALAKGNFNGDGFVDLAVGAPGEDVGSLTDTGVVHLLFGFGNGLSGAGFLTQNTANVPGQAEGGDRFGAALATGAYDNDRGGGGVDQLAVGAPGEDVGTAREAGAVTVLRGLNPDFPPSGGQLFTQGRVAGGVLEQLDQFGAALA